MLYFLVLTFTYPLTPSSFHPSRSPLCLFLHTLGSLRPRTGKFVFHTQRSAPAYLGVYVGVSLHAHHRCIMHDSQYGTMHDKSFYTHTYTEPLRSHTCSYKIRQKMVQIGLPHMLSSNADALSLTQEWCSSGLPAIFLRRFMFRLHRVQLRLGRKRA